MPLHNPFHPDTNDLTHSLPPRQRFRNVLHQRRAQPSRRQYPNGHLRLGPAGIKDLL